jgi:hypothetical protein
MPGRQLARDAQSINAIVDALERPVPRSHSATMITVPPVRAASLPAGAALTPDRASLHRQAIGDDDHAGAARAP